MKHLRGRGYRAPWTTGEVHPTVDMLLYTPGAFGQGSRVRHVDRVVQALRQTATTPPLLLHHSYPPRCPIALPIAPSTPAQLQHHRDLRLLRRGLARGVRARGLPAGNQGAEAVPCDRRQRLDGVLLRAQGTATSTLFWTIFHAFLSSLPPYTRRVMCATSCRGLSDADWGL